MSDTIEGVLMETDPTTDGSLRIFATPAPITRVAPDEAMANLARESAFDPEIFEERPPFFVRAVISNQSLDTYGTKMHESTLKNFAADAALGVSVQNSHNTRQLGIGRSVSGVYIPEQGGALARVESDFYTIPGIRLGDLNTDDFILGVRSGLIHDISVGFYGGEMRCALCGRDWWDWGCMHIPGVEYAKLDDKGNEVGREVAFFWVMDAHLSEYSVVYKGATSGSEIISIKAEREAEAGRLRPETAQLLNQRFRLNLPSLSRQYLGASVTPQTPESASDDSREGPSMPENENETERQPPESRATPPDAALVSLLTARSILQEGETPEAALSRILDDLPELQRLADQGRQYRARLVDDALKEGVRAQGNDFPEAQYRALLERPTTTLEEIERFTADWTAIAVRQFPGGRQTVESEEQGTTSVNGRGVPNAAFRD